MLAPEMLAPEWVIGARDPQTFWTYLKIYIEQSDQTAEALVRTLIKEPRRIPTLMEFLQRFQHDENETWRDFIEDFRRAAFADICMVLQKKFECEVFPHLHAAAHDQAVEKLRELADELELNELKLKRLTDLLPRLTDPPPMTQAEEQLLERLDWPGVQETLDRRGVPREPFLNLARACAGMILVGLWESRIRTLVVNEHEQGEVQDLMVLVREDPSTRELVRFDSEFSAAEDFKRALERGCVAAHELLRKRWGDTRKFVAQPLLGLKRQWIGPSMGLAMVVAVVARARGWRVNPEVGVTGAIEDGTHHVKAVAEVDKKLSVLEKDVGIREAIVPKDNHADVPPEWRHQVELVDTLDEVINSKILLDPWTPYFKRLSRRPREPLDRDHAERSVKRGGPQWVLYVCGFYDDPQARLDALASWCATLRDNDWQIPVPFFLKARRLSDQLEKRPGAALSAILEQIFTSSGDVAHERVLRQLQGDALFLVEGADMLACSSDLEANEPLVRSISGIARLVSSPPFHKNRVALSCNEATAEAVTELLRKDGVTHLTVPLYSGRSNFLDEHVARVKRAARDKILACRNVAGMDPQRFFYGPGRLYQEIRVRESDGLTSRSLEEVIRQSATGSRQSDQRVVILGEGGAGKSTELLKLFFDCVSEGSPLKDRFTPWLIELGQLLRDNAERLDLPAFLRLLMKKTPVRGELDRFRTEMQWTPRLLLLLDGLDEIRPPDHERDRIATTLREFVNLLPASAWVILTSRTKEAARATGSLLESHEFDDWRRMSVKERRWSEGEVREYLVNAGRSPEDTQQLLELVRQERDVLRDPMLLHLFCTTDSARVKRPSTRIDVYRAAMQTLLEREWNEKQRAWMRTFRFKDGEDPSEALVKLVGILAVGMKERGLPMVDDKTAAEIWGEFINNRHPFDPPDWWPRRLEEKDGKARAVGFLPGPDTVGRQTSELRALARLIAELPLLSRGG